MIWLRTVLMPRHTYIEHSLIICLTERRQAARRRRDALIEHGEMGEEEGMQH